MFAILVDYDWHEVFGFAGEGEANAFSTPTPCLGANCNADTFTREDVAALFHIHVGEHDGAEWMIIGKLNDNRYFCIVAGCCYTGWDCNSSGSAWVSDDLDNLYQFGTTNSVRDAFGL